MIIPRVIADQAVSAWQRTDSAAQPGSNFHDEAAILALRCQSIEESGKGGPGDFKVRCLDVVPIDLADRVHQ